MHWYTQHPSAPRAPPVPLNSLKHVSIIGQGNVALDVARMLLVSPTYLRKYDVPELVLSELMRSTVRHVSIIGRRGPLEAAFTTKELREMINLPSAKMLPVSGELLDNCMAHTAEKLTRQQTRVMQLLRKVSPQSPSAEQGAVDRTWSLEFFRSPMEVGSPPTASSSPTASSRPMANLKLAHTALDPKTRRAVPTGEHSTLPTSLVVTSLGFRGQPGSPFWNQKLGRIATDAGGRVMSGEVQVGKIIPNVYASGWAATGAKGVLASTMMNAYMVAETILADAGASKAGSLLERSVESQVMMDSETVPNPEARLIDDPPTEVVEGLRNGQVTTYEDWKAIEAEEVRKGESEGKERERMNWDEASAFLAAKRK